MKFPEFNFDFMGRRKLAGSLSIGLIVLSLASLTFNGLNFGLDFTGGTLVEVGFPESADPEALRSQLDDAGFVNGVVQHFGSETEVLIRMPPQAEGDPAGLGDRILDTIRQQAPGAEMRQSNFVGPVVGEELAESAGLAILTALAVVMLYI
ncbi:MAG: protein translocase subunit SecF, partial [Gammaproteobacteria bacterium]|nr:protein translocase subunit SecF [Gammaproteobacteria bacterium]